MCVDFNIAYFALWNVHSATVYTRMLGFTVVDFLSKNSRDDFYTIESVVCIVQDWSTLK